MKLLIFGSTGSIGRHLVQQALDQGHTVTAFVRDPAKLGMLQRPNLRIAEGDVLNPATVQHAVNEQDAVLCALGAGRKGNIRAAGTLAIMQAMASAGVKRLICQTTLGTGDSWNNLNFFWKHIMFGLLLRDAFADHELQEKYIRQSQLDWIIVRPGAFTDGERTGQYQHGFPSTARNITLKIARADVADFMLRQLTDNRYLHQTPSLSY